MKSSPYSKEAHEAADLIWGTFTNIRAHYDEESFKLTVAQAIDLAIQQAVNQTLDEALNSGDGTYRP